MIALSKVFPQAKRIVLPQITLHKPCNPSILAQKDRILVVYKGINYDLKKNGYTGHYGGFPVPFSDSQNYILEASRDLEIQKYGFVEDRHIRAHPDALNGIQDLRIFEWRDRIFVLGVAVSHKQDINGKLVKQNKAVLCELDGSCLRLVCFLPSRQQFEKNWMPWVKEGELYFIYNCDPFEVLKFEGKGISQSFRPLMADGLRFQSGSSCVLPLWGKFLGIIHKRYPGPLFQPPEAGELRKYTHSAVLYGEKFEVLAVSQEFTFEAERVEFCCGFALVENRIILSHGIWDREAVLLELPLVDFLDAVFSIEAEKFRALADPQNSL